MMNMKWLLSPFGIFAPNPQNQDTPAKQPVVKQKAVAPPVPSAPLTEKQKQEQREVRSTIWWGLLGAIAGVSYVAISTSLQDRAIENQYKAAQREVGLNTAFMPMGTNYKITADQGSCLHFLDANNTATKICFPKGTVVSGIPATETLADKQTGTRRLQVTLLEQGYPQGYALPMRDVAPLMPTRDTAASPGAAPPKAQP